MTLRAVRFTPAHYAPTRETRAQRPNNSRATISFMISVVPP